VLLPPTRALARAQSALRELPCGGGTPLAHAASAALRLGVAARARGGVSRVGVVFVTDGRANIPLALGEPGPGGGGGGPAGGRIAVGMTRGELRDEFVEAVRALGRAGFDVTLVDTSAGFAQAPGTRPAREVAEAARCQYVHVPIGAGDAGRGRIEEAVRAAAEEQGRAPPQPRQAPWVP